MGWCLSGTRIHTLQGIRLAEVAQSHGAAHDKRGTKKVFVEAVVAAVVASCVDRWGIEGQ